MFISKFGFAYDKVNRERYDGVSQSYVNNNFLRRDGTTSCAGSINMSGNTLINVSDPVNEHDVATKNYADNNFLRRDGTNECTGSIHMTGNTLTNVSDPVNEQDVATKHYADNNFLRTDGTGVCTGAIDMGGNALTNVSNPTNEQDVATKNYVDSITFDKVYLKAMVGGGGTPSTIQTLNVGENTHVDWTVFKSITGDYRNFNDSTGVFTAPFAGIYAVSLIARVQGDAADSKLTNTYFSVNNNTNYTEEVNIVYVMYSAINPMEWHTFHFSGFLQLNVGDTVRLKSSYGRGVFTIHSSAVMTITRFS